jgi:hypothetical protein
MSTRRFALDDPGRSRDRYPGQQHQARGQCQDDSSSSPPFRGASLSLGPFQLALPQLVLNPSQESGQSPQRVTRVARPVRGLGCQAFSRQVDQFPFGRAAVQPCKRFRENRFGRWSDCQAASKSPHMASIRRLWDNED